MRTQLVLIGVAGAGKADVAREVSQQLGWPVHDSLQLAGQLAGEDPDLLFVRFGAEKFRELAEQGALQALGQQGVVVLSPDSVLSEGVQAILRGLDKTQSLVVELYADFNTLVQRTGINAPRTADLGPVRRTFRLLMESYREAYSPYADEKIDTSLSKPALIAQRVVALLG